MKDTLSIDEGRVDLAVDGQRLTGTLLRPEAPVPGFLFVHGWGGDQEEDLGHAEELARLGCVCFTFDLRGHAGSDARRDAHVRGYGGGLGSDPGGSDGETVTPVGLLNGFTQPSAMSYWQHQAFDYAFFASLGFTKSFYDSSHSFDLPGYSFSALLSNGNTITGGGGFATVPEPATWAMMIMGLGGAGAVLRHRRRTALAV